MIMKQIILAQPVGLPCQFMCDAPKALPQLLENCCHCRSLEMRDTS